MKFLLQKIYDWLEGYLKVEDSYLSIQKQNWALCESLSEVSEDRLFKIELTRRLLSAICLDHDGEFFVSQEAWDQTESLYMAADVQYVEGGVEVRLSYDPE